MSNIYENIKRRREQLGLSQEELAQRMGYKSRSSINKIESGENDIPQSKIVAFAKSLNTTPAYLMGWEDEEPKVIDEVAQLRASAETDPEVRALFSLAKDCTKEELEQAIEIIKVLRKSGK